MSLAVSLNGVLRAIGKDFRAGTILETAGVVHAPTIIAVPVRQYYLTAAIAPDHKNWPAGG
jgi:hypothetical protein